MTTSAELGVYDHARDSRPADALPNVSLRLSLPTYSGTDHYRVRAHVAPSGRQHGSPWTVTGFDIAATDLGGVHTLATVDEASFRRELDRCGRGGGWLDETLIDRFVARSEGR